MALLLALILLLLLFGYGGLALSPLLFIVVAAAERVAWADYEGTETEQEEFLDAMDDLREAITARDRERAQG